MTPFVQLRPDELIIDNFAGGGGASLGIEMALGRSPDYAINHNRKALAMHARNHPETIHLCEDVWDVDPAELVAGRLVGLAWFSPDCKHFSKAKGGKPVEKAVRGLAWVVIRWAEAVKPRVIILENVAEFQTWGPLLEDGRPDPARKGETFREWLGRLRAAGYVVEHREMKACDYGAPTTRSRFFLIARSDGQAIVWPEPTHGPGRALPWRTAAECIDWLIPCPSIFDRAKPLAENTLKRIARGLKRYVIDAAEPFIVPLTHHGDRRAHPLSEPMPTVTGAHRGEQALVTPYIARIAQTGGNGAYTNDIREPLSTLVTKAEHLLVAPTLVQTGYGERDGQAPRSLDLQEPLGTIVAGGNKHALVTSFLAKHYGGFYEGAGSQLTLPIDTITTADHHALVVGHLQRDFGKSIGSALDEPALATTAGGGGHQALVASHLLKLRGGVETHQDTAQDLREPAPTLTAGGTHVAAVQAFLVKYYGTDGPGAQLDLPLDTVTTRDRFGLVMVQGVLHAIVDIGMRMLWPRELFRAQGFPDTFEIDFQFEGKPLSKTDQVSMCGNSVSPMAAAALVRANFGQPVALPAVGAWFPPTHVKVAQQLRLFDLAEGA
jgi:DNA (cytosine-5)-methyltransferase 1